MVSYQNHRANLVEAGEVVRFASGLLVFHTTQPRCGATRGLKSLHRRDFLTARSPPPNNRPITKAPIKGALFLVEAGGVEPPSENPSTAFSTSVAGVLSFPPQSPQRQGQCISSFIKSHLRQSLCRLVPYDDDARGPAVGLRIRTVTD